MPLLLNLTWLFLIALFSFSGLWRAGGVSAATVTLKQAWQTYCRDHHRCRGMPAVPQRAYVISLPNDSPKREVLLPRLLDLGLEVEVVDGIPSDQVVDTSKHTICRAARNSNDCQAGLTLAHVEAWKRVVSSGEPAAWILEDDAVFHDDIALLFPEYWSKAPHAFELIFVGYILPEVWAHSRTGEEVVVSPVTTPFGTHAYIISVETAERLALWGDYMISRSRLEDGDKVPWQIDGDDIKIDHFIKNYYDKMLPKEDRQKWAIFDSPPRTPWSYRNVTSPGNSNCICNCDDIDGCIREGKAPVRSSGGLASQHSCGRLIPDLLRWHEIITDKQAEYNSLCNGTTTQ